MLLHRLEMVQRSAVCVVLRLNRRDQDSVTAALRELHWLPVTQRIQFKLLTLMHGAVHAGSPRYLAERVTAYVSYRCLRSPDQTLFVVPRISLERFGRRDVSCAGPSLWNSLPSHLRTQCDSELLRKSLTLFFFKQAFY